MNLKDCLLLDTIEYKGHKYLVEKSGVATSLEDEGMYRRTHPYQITGDKAVTLLSRDTSLYSKFINEHSLSSDYVSQSIFNKVVAFLKEHKD